MGSSTLNFSIPTSTISDIGAQVTSNIGALSPIAVLIISLLLAFLVIEFLVSVFSNKKNDNV